MTAIIDPTKDPADIDRARKALQDYLNALDRTEAAHAKARDALRDLGPNAGTVRTLHIEDDRRTARRLLARLPTSEQYTRPTHRHVRLTNGTTGRFAVQTVREFVRDGLVADWLDGMPPEEPAPEFHPVGPMLVGHRNTTQLPSAGGMNSQWRQATYSRD